LNKLYRNECGPNHWLIVKIKGTISNSSGIGARLVVKVESLSMTREVSGGSGFASQNSLPLEFGLGSFPSVDTISVKWPSGISQSLVCLEGDTIITITEEIIGIYDTKHPLSEANPTYRIFPNPFTSKTTIFYLVSNYFHVSLSIYDLSGNLVRMLLDSPRPVGSYSINWDGTDERDREIPSGIYFIKNSSDQKIKVIKLR